MQSSSKKKIIRVTTVPLSLHILLRGQLKFIQNYYTVIGVSSSGALLEEVKEREGITTYPVEMSRVISPFSDLVSLWQLYRFLKKEKPFIVHSHTPKAGIVAMLAAKFAGVPHRLHTVGGLPLVEAVGVKRSLLKQVEKITYACATRVFSNSYGLKELILREQFCEPFKIKVIGNGSSNGIDTAYFSVQSVSETTKNSLREQLGISETDFVFVFVGRLVGDKGVNELVAAFSNLNITYSNVKLLLVGWLESDLDPLSQTTMQLLTSHRTIINVGYQKDIRSYLALGNVFVFPSYREGFPNAVLQAGAMGLPSIVSDINGCNEIIIHGENGIIVPVKNTNALQQAMQRMIEDEATYAYLQSNARPYVVSRYEQKEIWEALLAEYHMLEQQ